MKRSVSDYFLLSLIVLVMCTTAAGIVISVFFAVTGA